MKTNKLIYPENERTHTLIQTDNGFNNNASAGIDREMATSCDVKREAGE